jgi:hypothetical protein
MSNQTAAAEIIIDTHGAAVRQAHRAPFLRRHAARNAAEEQAHRAGGRHAEAEECFNRWGKLTTLADAAERAVVAWALRA